MAYTLQLKRHVNYASKEAALNGLKAYLATASVGEPAIATYGGSEQTYDSEKVLFGIKGAYGYTIFNADAIPSEVQSALDAAIAAIKGGEDSAINDAYDTIKEIADALVKINGEGEGSIKKAKQDAINYANDAIKALDVTDNAVAKSFVTKVSETDGKIAVERGAITSSDKTVVIGDVAGGGIDLKANVDDSTIVINKETGVMSVASAAIVQYVGQDAIAVSEEAEGEKTISLKLNADDKVLTQNADGLFANISMTWDKTNGLKLTGKGGAEIATVPAADFIKDGMLENVTLEKNPVGQTAGTYLHFVFNTDAKKTDKKTDIYVNVTELIDIYTGSNGVQVSGKNIIAVKDDSSESFLSIGPSGIKVSGVQDAIDAAKRGVQTAIDTVESSVGLAADGSHVKATGNYTKDATTVVGEIAALDTQVKLNENAIAAETSRATAEENRIVKNVIGADKLQAGESVMGVFEEFTTVAREQITALGTQVTENTDAIKALDKKNSDAIKAETTRATKAEQQLQEAIDAVGNAAISVVAGNGINISGSGTEKTITAVAKVSDPMIEVTNKGIGLKDNAVFDCGTY